MTILSMSLPATMISLSVLKQRLPKLHYLIIVSFDRTESISGLISKWLSIRSMAFYIKESILS